MGKNPSERLQELIFGSSDKSESAKISSLEKSGLIKKIASNDNHLLTIL
jgi:hypothetical protein